ncbi:hypothetical protein TELCIR_09707 [Teladorsagia circumcincta]|uniref:Shavenoid isoform B-like N-terminal domain-containing protein n=1 Tax=Teladorsagia circumcincta TaxID=45464 RepID=A0A2G9UE20_TELCI|nr:hypothetical protein TELCIR_09707 [Teladorsagia circumcincta]
MRNSVRKPGLPDALFPSVCPPSCSQLFHAEEAMLNDSLSDRCSCVCPTTAPVYLNTAGYCVDRLEYLDDAMMANPPPVAEQFLTDLRRVIEVARERIRMRRFVPMLITIPEDLEENRYAVVSEIKTDKTEPANQQESPKSDKSVDSGRESRSDSDDSSRDDEEDHHNEAGQPWKDHSGPERISSVRSIVSGFESRTSGPTQPPAPSTPPPTLPKIPLPKPSRIPPRIPAKPRLISSQIPTLLGEASPRPPAEEPSISSDTFIAENISSTNPY